MARSADRSEIAPSDTVAITVTDVSFAYNTGNGQSYRPVLDGISLAFLYGHISGVAGSNASGKTTLLNIIRGVLAPQHGTVSVNGQTISNEGRQLAAADVAVVSQNPSMGLAPTMTVFENFILATKGPLFDLRPAYGTDARLRCKGLLRSAGMNLETKIDEQVRFLSGGQQQALSILLSFNDGGRILLLDEPTAALSPTAADEMFKLLSTEVLTKQACAVVVSHRVQELITHCDTIVILGGGRAAHVLQRGAADWSELRLSELLASEAAVASMDAKL